MRFFVLIVDGEERARSTDMDPLGDMVLEEKYEDWDIRIEDDPSGPGPEELVIELDGSPYPKKLQRRS